MVKKGKKIPKVSVNYRRKAGTPMAENIISMAMEMNCTPNQLIDLLVMEEKLRRITNVR